MIGRLIGAAIFFGIGWVIWYSGYQYDPGPPGTYDVELHNDTVLVTQLIAGMCALFGLVSLFGGTKS